MVSWIYMAPDGHYQAEGSGRITFMEWQRFCLPALLWQRRRGGGTFIVFHGRVR